jgi:MFS family permease
MARLLRIYFNALFGGLGGLLGWMLFGELVSASWDWWTQALIGGVLIGALIGYFVVSVDAILDRSLVRFCRFATFGVILGGLGGAAGYWIGDWVNYLLVSNLGTEQTSLVQVISVLARGFGWLIFGLAVGISEGIASRSLGKMSYGAIGGSLGGFIGGVTFAWLMLVLDKGDSSYVWGQAIGLVVLGACIGALTALVEEVFKPAAIKVMRGWQEGREYPLIKGSSVLGRDEGVDVLLLRDMKVEKRHAMIQRHGNRFLLVNNNAPASNTLVNGEPVAQSAELHDGDRIQLGNVVLRFLMRAAKERQKRAAPAPIPRN